MGDLWEDEGGPAFPSTARQVSHEEETEIFYKGMSLRDYFAGQAIAGALSMSPDNLARWAYQCADALLNERDKRGGQ
jgi:hypothetical protein